MTPKCSHLPQSPTFSWRLQICRSQNLIELIEGMDSIASLLEKHGEKFMAQFEPSATSMATSPLLKQPRKHKVQQLKAGKQEKEASKTLNKASGKKGEILAAPTPPEMVGRKRASSALDEIEALMQRRGSGFNAAPSITHMEASHTKSTSGIDYKMERRAFMSHRADKVHSKPTERQVVSNGTPGGSLNREIDASLLSPEEFRKLQIEVEKLGGSALDKKQRKLWQAAFLSRIGAKSDKLPRMSAKIGGGIAKKRKERDARDKALKIESGDLRVKGQGAKKRKERSESYDRGLQEAGPGFKNGVLRVKSK